MSIVKGTKQHRVKVIEDRPFVRIALIFGGLVLSVLGIVFSHQYGLAKGTELQQSAMEDLSELREALVKSQQRAGDLEQQLANINLGAEVDRQANEEIRQEVITLKEQIAQLEEENSFYRGLMAPTKNKRGLTFGAVELSQTERPRTYNYKVVMQQLATNHQLLSGTLEYRVVGRNQGLEASYNLRQLSDQVNVDRIKLRFKYFQTIEGELSLPEGFEPVAIELLARSSGRNPVTVEKRFGWLVEEV